MNIWLYFTHLQNHRVYKLQLLHMHGLQDILPAFDCVAMIAWLGCLPFIFRFVVLRFQKICIPFSLQAHELDLPFFS
ncbi:hypothetical protein KR52_09970 [Synechococcus sp. KORDI-52]|nr:hypothetical protein KR52_09970 [Synechococcus sp. KORDI-52]